MIRKFATMSMVLLCAPVFAQVQLSRSPNPNPSAAPPAASDGGVAGILNCGAVDLTQNTDPNTVVVGLSVACFDGGNNCTIENDYARSFNLAVGPTAGLAHYVRCVEYGVDQVLDSDTGFSPITVNLFIDTSGGAPNIASLLPLAGGSITDSVPSGDSGTLRIVDFTANNVLVPADATLVVTVESDDLCTINGPNNLYFNGANNSGQSAPSYIRAPGCGILDFTDFAAIGFPNQHMVLTVDLDPACGDAICDTAGGEDACTCPDDCFDQSTCGDGCCDVDILGEDSCSCPLDCSASCGDGCCNPGEDACNCANDCFDQSTCGDGCCDVLILGEDCSNCPPDCGCDSCEICSPNALQDFACTSACGNGVCDPACENCTNCPADCECLGTCCLFEGGCQTNVTASDCQSGNGLYQGNGSSCPTSPPCQPLGSCCIENACTDLREAIYCLGQNGDFFEGAFCVDTTCPLVGGACCTADGCIDRVSNGACASSLGIFHDGALCADTECRIYACCVGTSCKNSVGLDCQPSNLLPLGITCESSPCAGFFECLGQPIGTTCGANDGNACTTICDPSGLCGIDCDDDNECTIDSCDPAIGCTRQAVVCEDNNACTDNSCDPTLGCTYPPSCGNGVCDPACEDCSTCPVDCGCAATLCQIITCDPGGPDPTTDAQGCTSGPDPACGACCFENEDCQVLDPGGCALADGVFRGAGSSCTEDFCIRDQRLSTVKKGSILIFPKVELRWDALGVLTQDTILTLVNDFTRDVHVKLYLIHGDAPTEAVYADALQTILVERAHNGWNSVNCNIELTENESTYLVMSTGVGGCQRFTILDPGTPPGRPNLEPDGGRVLRGYVIAFATDENQEEISYNHLSGHADLIHYGLRSAWEYQAYAFQALNPTVGAAPDANPGELSLNGLEYENAYNTLLFDFFASGSPAFTNGSLGVLVLLDGDLTLHPVSVDLRQDSCGPITTKAHFDIWNANEDFRSGTARCITCWDQTLLSAYSAGNGLDNNFILGDLGTDKGKARINGMASFECDNLFVPPSLDDAILQWLLLHDRVCDVTVAGKEPEPEEDCCTYTINDSQSVALLGVAAKVLTFSGGAVGRTWAGMNLVGAGQEAAQILFDIPAGPETASDNDRLQSGKNVSERNSMGQNSDK